MKRQWIFMGLMLMFIASACTKDALNTKDESPTLKKADLKISSEFMLYLDEVKEFTFNPPLPSPLTLPVAGRMEGIIPHLGILQVGTVTDFRHGSYWEDSSPTPALDKKGLPCLYYGNTITHYIAANGDELTGKVWGFIYDWETYPNGRPGDGLSWEGEFEYIGGTGRFANATGGGTTTGKFSPDSYAIMIMKVEGMISNVGQSKKFPDE